MIRITVEPSDQYGGCWVARIGGISVFDYERAEALASAIRVHRYSRQFRQAARRRAN